jgi:hypothetical protein
MGRTECNSVSKLTNSNNESYKVETKNNSIIENKTKNKNKSFSNSNGSTLYNQFRNSIAKKTNQSIMI